MSGVCSAGFATTQLPAASAPATWPVKIARRKIPRTDANENAATAHAQFVALASRARQRHRCKRAARLAGIVATIVRCFTHFRNTIVDRLAAFVLQERDQPAAILLDQIAGAFECRRSIRNRRCVPAAKSGVGRGERGGDDGFIAFLHGADGLAVDRRIDHPFPSGDRDAVDQWFCVRALRYRANFGEQRFERSAVAEFNAGRIAPDSAKQIARQWNMRMARMRIHRRSSSAAAAEWLRSARLGSVATDTNEELAPFSRSRRTR